MGLTRRQALQLSMGGALGLGMQAAFPELMRAEATKPGAQAGQAGSAEWRLYSDLLKNWCDGLVARQVVTPDLPAYRGGLLCVGEQVHVKIEAGT